MFRVSISPNPDTPVKHTDLSDAEEMTPLPECTRTNASTALPGGVMSL